jgi:hypothetical protein
MPRSDSKFNVIFADPEVGDVSQFAGGRAKLRKAPVIDQVFISVPFVMRHDNVQSWK